MNETNIKSDVQQLIDSERMLNDLMGNLPGIVYRCHNDNKWTMIFLNEKCFELTGYQVEDFLNNKTLSYLDIIHPDDSEMVWDKVQKAISLKKRFEMTYRIITESKEQKWVWEKGKGVFDKKGKLLYIEGFISDITKTVESEKRYRETIELAVDGFLISDIEGNIIDANTSMLKMTGCSLDEIKNKHISKLFQKSELQAKPLRFDLVLKGETVINVRNLVSKNGEIIPVEMHSKRMPNNTLQAIVRDISARKKSELSIIESEEKYRNLFDKSMDPTLLIDESKFIDCNDAAVEMLKFSNKKAVLNSHPSLLSPKYQSDGKLSKDKADEMMEIAIKKGYHRFEWEHITTDGEVFSVDVSLTRIPVEGKEMLYTIWRDISERKISEKRQQALYNISNASLSSESL